MSTAPSPSAAPSSGPPTSPPDRDRLRRRGLATVASVAGAGAAVSAFMLAPSSAVPAAAHVVTSDLAALPAARVAPVARTAAAPRRVSARAPARRTTSPTHRSAPTRSAALRAERPRRAATHNGGRTGATATGAPAAMSMPGSASCTGLNAAVDAFMQHFYAAHLETSPGQQVADALSLDQYATTHTVLVENMLKPLVGGGTAALDVFLQHVYAAHLETSPGQQAADALAVDQYVLTHTVMVADMVAPLVGTDLSSC